MRTPSEVAELIRMAMEKLNDEKAITRFQMSLKGFGALAQRDFVDQFYLASLTSELKDRGWCMFQISHTSYSLIRHESASKFRKLSSETLLASIYGEEGEESE
ncbi:MULTISPECIES: hypothetical protein [Enterobacteriaceae]|uniref:hypothetical protein n=1 Tax=Enterobacteriaceae TaxID=543 RepID=UPI000981AB58|nr:MULTISPECIES: hypothetical protein [Enterobacteriaceae]MCE9985168.1 hypothetical protein [Leclercia adecarboxylata]OOB84605.1 hypothetical protein BZY71_23870 [Leclercia adecarboxylata]